jgi:hypothetical protein
MAGDLRTSFPIHGVLVIADRPEPDQISVGSFIETILPVPRGPEGYTARREITYTASRMLVETEVSMN